MAKPSLFATPSPAARRNAVTKPRKSLRGVNPATCEREYSTDEVEFMQAMDRYKRDNDRPYPTWSEVLSVLLSLGYRKA